MRALYVILWLFSTLPLTACGMAGAPIHGKVVEAGTLKPIPGAIVIAKWQGVMPVPGHGVHRCFHVETTTTNDKGEFHFPLWVDVPKYIAEVETLMEAYKSGYGYPEVPSQKDEIIWMTPFKGSARERLEYLSDLRRFECGSLNDYSKKLLPLYEAVYREALQMGVTPEERKIISSLRYSLDILKLGYEEAQRRLKKGRYE